MQERSETLLTQLHQQERALHQQELAIRQLLTTHQLTPTTVASIPAASAQLYSVRPDNYEDMDAQVLQVPFRSLFVTYGHQLCLPYDPAATLQQPICNIWASSL